MKKFKKSLSFIILILALTTLSACNSDDNNSSQSALSKRISEINASITCMRDAFDKAQERVTTPNYDNYVSDKGRTLSEIDALIEEKQEQIDKLLEN